MCKHYLSLISHNCSLRGWHVGVTSRKKIKYYIVDACMVTLHVGEGCYECDVACDTGVRVTMGCHFAGCG